MVDRIPSNALLEAMRERLRHAEDAARYWQRRADDLQERLNFVREKAIRRINWLEERLEEAGYKTNN